MRPHLVGKKKRYINIFPARPSRRGRHLSSHTLYEWRKYIIIKETNLFTLFLLSVLHFELPVLANEKNTISVFGFPSVLYTTPMSAAGFFFLSQTQFYNFMLFFAYILPALKIEAQVEREREKCEINFNLRLIKSRNGMERV